MSDDLTLVQPVIVGEITISSDALTLKTSALDMSSVVFKVSNAAEQEIAVHAQAELKRVSDLFEKQRQAATRPLLDAQRKLKDAVDKHRSELSAELMRVSKLVGDFQALELAKARAAEVARRKELEEIERRKQEEIAKAKSHDEIESIQQRANIQAAALPVSQPIKASGQIVREEWDFELTDIWALARAHPALVNIEPRRREIKEMLNLGVSVAGIRAWKDIKSSVRTPTRQAEAIGV